MTKEEAEEAAPNKRNWERRWKEIAVTKDASTAARIADVLDKHGFNYDARPIRGKCVYSHLCV